MIELSSFIHREALRTVMARWLVHDLQPGDAYLIKRLINFNSLYVRRVRGCLARSVLPRIYGHGFVAMPLHTKGELRDLIRDTALTRNLVQNARIAELVDRYSKQPETYFRETPYEGVAYHEPDDRVPMAFSRIKRIRRIAEKCSRRIADSVFHLVQEEVRQLAEKRSGERRTAPHEPPISPAESGAAFREAEERVLTEIRSGRLFHRVPDMTIEDVLGFKLLGDEKLAQRLQETIEGHPDLGLVERQVHTGEYEAVNYVVRWRVPPQELTQRGMPEEVERILRERGLTGDLMQDFRKFVAEGEPELRLEIIFQSYEQMMESELGRCMHEERVIRQRYDQSYRGFVVRNIRVLIQYLFCFAISRTRTCDEIPIKLWVRYMPDYHDHVLSTVSDFPAGNMGLTP